MSRRLVDGQEPYRVIIVARLSRPNPDYTPLNYREVPYYLYDGDEYQTSYGPYSLGAARAQLTNRSPGGAREQAGFTDGWIEKSTTAWERI